MVVGPTGGSTPMIKR